MSIIIDSRPAATFIQIRISWKNGAPDIVTLRRAAPKLNEISSQNTIYSEARRRKADNSDCPNPLTHAGKPLDPMNKIVVGAFWYGWLAIAIGEACYFFVVPHGPHFAPELGVGGAFRAFLAVYTFWYLLTSLLTLVPFYVWFERSNAPKAIWAAALIGAVVYSAVCLGVSTFWLQLSPMNRNLSCVYWALAGASAIGKMRFSMNKNMREDRSRPS